MHDKEKAMLLEIYTALFEVPPGSSKDAKTLMVEIRDAVKFHQRTAWTARMVVWALPTLAGLGVAVKTLIALLKEAGQ